jgi:2-oxoglutarate dehydrogenase E1 component
MNNLQTPFPNMGSASYLETLYQHYLTDPSSVATEWVSYFQQFSKMNKERTDTSHSVSQQQLQVSKLIDAYRGLGHLHADIDPLKLRKKPTVPELLLSFYNLSDAELEVSFESGGLPGPRNSTLRTIIAKLKKIYCGTIAVEYMHIIKVTERRWLQQQVEALFFQEPLDFTIQKRILECLIAAEGLEKYLGAKYPGAKRFSLEGLDSLIVCIEALLQFGGAKGAKEIVLGMAHRGRLNILVNVLGKTPSQLFDEFDGNYTNSLESGDVKYHQGFSADVATAGGHVHVSMLYNPSHLEIVTPVACGSVRARQDRRFDDSRKDVFAVALHGDAAISGQGVVMETLNMSRTDGFTTGGTIHIITNNQIGFTSSDPREARSNMYASDIGKMIDIPIFHVNADDPEAVYLVTKLALDYREKFKKEVIIDLVGYRRQGHNEADDPTVTQPLMYKTIRTLPTVLKLYQDKLKQNGKITEKVILEMVGEYRAKLENKHNSVAKNLVEGTTKEDTSDWTSYFTQDWRTTPKTAVELVSLQAIGRKITALPEGFVLHPRVQKIITDRIKMTEGDMPLDWGYAEMMAYATLLQAGYPVRLTGQDSARGTFFHRHAVLHDQENGREYTPLAHIAAEQAPFTIVNSLLSEAAVLGFEYGYATTEAKGLTLWEAQFGDFANNAQVVIDQFLSSGEQKWRKLCGLTLLLPHGYEGQGPEHSSARLERYLQLCAEYNLQVCIPTTPAQLFHLLRRQVLRLMRKPLVIMTPKSLLRHKLAVSTLQALSDGTFYPVLSEEDPITKNKIRRIIFCSGKIYYELLVKRRQRRLQDILIFRIEQLYPFPDFEITEILKSYPEVKDLVWCQEEPENQGAWYSISRTFQGCLLPGQYIGFIGRAPAAAPAAGCLHLHNVQQTALIDEALQ